MFNKMRFLSLLSAFLFLGCGGQAELNQAPEEIEERRQNFVKQSEREMNESAFPE